MTNLEQVLLIIQAFLFLVSKLGQRVVKSIIVNQLVVTLGDGLSDDFQNTLELLDGTNHTTLDKLKLRCYGGAQFVQMLSVGRGVLNSGGSGGIFVG